MADPAARAQAEKRVAAKQGFYIHFGVFVVVMTALAAINLTTSTQYIWFKWPLAGWGIGVLFHGLRVFVFSETSRTTERMIERELERDGRRNT